MLIKSEILEYVEQLERAGGALSAPALSNRFRVTLKAATKHVLALWREELLESRMQRARGWRYRLRPGEQLGRLSFRLAKRGRERLAYYRRALQEDKEPIEFL